MNAHRFVRNLLIFHIPLLIVATLRSAILQSPSILFRLRVLLVLIRSALPGVSLPIGKVVNANFN